MIGETREHRQYLNIDISFVRLSDRPRRLLSDTFRHCASTIVYRRSHILSQTLCAICKCWIWLQANEVGNKFSEKISSTMIAEYKSRAGILRPLLFMSCERRVCVPFIARAHTNNQTPNSNVKPGRKSVRAGVAVEPWHGCGYIRAYARVSVYRRFSTNAATTAAVVATTAVPNSLNITIYCHANTEYSSVGCLFIKWDQKWINMCLFSFSRLARCRAVFFPLPSTLPSPAILTRYIPTFRWYISVSHRQISALIFVYI